MGSAHSAGQVRPGRGRSLLESENPLKTIDFLHFRRVGLTEFSKIIKTLSQTCVKPDFEHFLVHSGFPKSSTSIGFMCVPMFGHIHRHDAPALAHI